MVDKPSEGELALSRIGLSNDSEEDTIVEEQDGDEHVDEIEDDEPTDVDTLEDSDDDLETDEDDDSDYKDEDPDEPEEEGLKKKKVADKKYREKQSKQDKLLDTMQKQLDAQAQQIQQQNDLIQQQNLQTQQHQQSTKAPAVAETTEDYVDKDNHNNLVKQYNDSSAKLQQFETNQVNQQNILATLPGFQDVLAFAEENNLVNDPAMISLEKRGDNYSGRLVLAVTRMKDKQIADLKIQHEQDIKAAVAKEIKKFKKTKKSAPPTGGKFKRTASGNKGADKEYNDAWGAFGMPQG